VDSGPAHGIRYPQDVSIFNKRNALVGYVALKALKRERKRKRHTWKLAAFVVLGIVSAGILVAVAAVVLRRQKDAEGEAGDGQRLEGYAVADELDNRDPTDFDVELPGPGVPA
jgi:hypothetical protein